MFAFWGTGSVREREKQDKKNGEAWQSSSRRGGEEGFSRAAPHGPFTFRPFFFFLSSRHFSRVIREFSYMVCSNLVSATFSSSFPAFRSSHLQRRGERGWVYKPILYDTVSPARRHHLNRVSPSSIQDGERSFPMLGSGALTGCLTDPHAHAPAACEAGTGRDEAGVKPRLPLFFFCIVLQKFCPYRLDLLQGNPSAKHMFALVSLLLATAYSFSFFYFRFLCLVLSPKKRKFFVVFSFKSCDMMAP